MRRLSKFKIKARVYKIRIKSSICKTSKWMLDFIEFKMNTRLREIQFLNIWKIIEENWRFWTKVFIPNFLSRSFWTHILISYRFKFDFINWVKHQTKMFWLVLKYELKEKQVFNFFNDPLVILIEILIHWRNFNP